MKNFASKSESDTADFASKIALNAQPGDIYALRGDLGMGKSVFARGFIRALCGNNTEVPSPTFTLVQTYEAKKAPVWHFDLYRIKAPEDILELGWDEALNGGIALIEWPERAEDYLPTNRTDILFTAEEDESRMIACITMEDS